MYAFMNDFQFNFFCSDLVFSCDSQTPSPAPQALGGTRDRGRHQTDSDWRWVITITMSEEQFVALCLRPPVGCFLSICPIISFHSSVTT